ncbi:centromere-associated protein E isoform X2 [Fundulus heteroclitus]|uniref:centromere-associated protein E isoform X2 n=1 Tax=Fundulus heteroclitus TaxID=8078 RepID=UPI00165C5050|nr:centromere-associated protein E isoform X2 [Fundulus heteroclitus]
MAAESAVKVCVRIRPVVAREEKAASEKAQPVQLFWKADKKSICQIDDGNSSKSFSFDRVFTAEESTSQLYMDIAKPLVVSTVEGYNGTIFAYGQTSSGKTFTMMGSDRNPGVIPLAVDDVFQTIKNFPNKEFLLRVSYMEIYNETVTDLLVDSWKRKPLEVRETIDKTIYVAELTEELVTSSAQALAWIRKGETNRHYGKTKMNQWSSRSHTIFRMILESRERTDPALGENADGAIFVSHLNLVDLAGSERASQTGAEGARLKEGCNINLSLFTLGQVIKKLTDESQKGFTNYRDSKLTRILQNSLGGNAKTVIISTITPVSLDETLSTLQFASTAKKMKNDPHVTEVLGDGALLKRYRNEILDLKCQLNKVSSVTHTAVTEKEVLAQLLEEKEQLQREQEDRIKTLTKLLVTSSNPVSYPKMPKRRVTWGGKMVKHTHPSAFNDDGMPRMNMTFGWKRKADRLFSSETDEDFYPHWEIPEEPSDEMEMSQSSVTVRSFGESPTGLVSSDGICAQSEKISNLDWQFEIESQRREEAVKKVEMLESRVAELLLHVQSEALQKLEAVKKTQATEVLLQNEVKEKLDALEKMQTMEQRIEDLQFQLQSETKLKLEAVLQMQAAEHSLVELKRVLETETEQKLECNDMLKLKVSDPERQLEEQKHTESDQMRKCLADSVQLCEFLAAEKEKVIAERDYLKQELGIFLEHTKRLEKEKAEELKELKDLNEFTRLENKVIKEQEIKGLTEELQSVLAEKDQLLAEKESSAEKLEKLQCDLMAINEERNQLDMVVKELTEEKKKLQAQLEENNQMGLPEELQSVLAEKDQLLAEKESSAEKLEKLQCDLMAINEERNQLDMVVKELTEEKKKLQAQLEENNQMGLPEELQSVLAEKDQLLAEKESSAEKLEKLQCDLMAINEERNQLDMVVKELTEEKKKLQAQLEENNQMGLPEELQSVLAEKDQLLAEKESSAEKLDMLQCDLMAINEERNQLDMVVKELTEEKKKLQAQLEENNQMGLPEELQSVLAEKDQLLAEKESSAEKLEKLQCDLMAINEERNQLDMVVKELTEEKKKLQAQLEENNQMGLPEELQSVLAEKDQLLAEKESSAEKLEKLQCDLMAINEERNQLDMVVKELTEEKKKLQAQLEENNQMGLPEELQSVLAEKDQLLAEKESSAEKLEKLQCDLMAINEERNQLDMVVKELTEEKKKLQAQLEENNQMGLPEELQSVLAEKDQLLAEKESSAEKLEKLQCDLMAINEERNQLDMVVKELTEEKKLQAQLEENNQMGLPEELQSVLAEKDQLLAEKESSAEKLEKLQCDLMAINEERNQLDMVVKELTEEKKKLQAQLEENNQMGLPEELQSVLAEKDQLLAEKESSAEKLEKLQCDLMAINEERNQLDMVVKELTEEKKKLQAQLEENNQMIGELNMSVQIVTDQKRQLEEHQQQLEEKASSSEELLKAVKNDLDEQKKFNCELKKIIDEKSSVDQKVTELADSLASVEAEKNFLLSEKWKNLQSHKDEMEKLQFSLMALSQERDSLQEVLVGLREEKEQLGAQLQENMNMMTALQEKLTQQEFLTVEKEAENMEEQAKLKQELQYLQEELQVQQKRRALAESKSDASQQLLDEANSSLSALRQQLNSLEHRPNVIGETLSRLQDSANHLVEAFGKFHEFTATCSKYDSETLEEVLRVQCSLKHISLASFPKSVVDTYGDVCGLGLHTSQTLIRILGQLKAHSHGYVKVFELVINKDLAIFEERRLQDLLLSRHDAPKYSVNYEDFHSLWNERLTELLDKRLLYQQKMEKILEKLWANLTSYLTLWKAEILERVKFKEALQAAIIQPVFTGLEPVLSQEAERRRSVVQKGKMSLQSITEEQNKIFDELKQLDAQRDSQLKEEKGKNATLLQALEGTPLKTELSLLMDYKQLVLQLQQAERGLKGLPEELQSVLAEKDQLLAEKESSAEKLEKLQCDLMAINEERNQLDMVVKELTEEKKKLQAQLEENNQMALREKIGHLEEAINAAKETESNNKRAIQLLQTELQDAWVVAKEKESTIQTLKVKLEEFEKKSSPSAAELAILQRKLFEMEVKLASLTDEHQEEIQRMKMVLSVKEESLRKLKQELRSQQQSGEASLTGKELHARLTNPRRMVIQSSILLDKTKLEEEVTQLQLRITELESLVSSQQAETNKWKSRAISLKGKSKAELDKQSSQCDSSETLSRNRPRHFFDNSDLGIKPESSHVPAPSDEAFTDAEVEPDTCDILQGSPKEQDYCKSQ